MNVPTSVLLNNPCQYVILTSIPSIPQSNVVAMNPFQSMGALSSTPSMQAIQSPFITSIPNAVVVATQNTLPVYNQFAFNPGIIPYESVNPQINQIRRNIQHINANPLVHLHQNIQKERVSNISPLHHRLHHIPFKCGHVPLPLNIRTSNTNYPIHHNMAPYEPKRKEATTRVSVFECPICHKNFSRKSNLKQHLKIHSNICDFICPFCSRGFKQKHSMVDHIRTHTGERPFKCKHCSKAFKVKHNLMTHTRLHTGERPYYCSLCDKRFVSKSSLNAHSKSKHPK